MENCLCSSSSVIDLLLDCYGKNNMDNVINLLENYKKINKKSHDLICYSCYMMSIDVDNEKYNEFLKETISFLCSDSIINNISFSLEWIEYFITCGLNSKLCEMVFNKIILLKPNDDIKRFLINSVKNSVSINSDLLLKILLYSFNDDISDSNELADCILVKSVIETLLEKSVYIDCSIDLSIDQTKSIIQYLVNVTNPGLKRFLTIEPTYKDTCVHYKTKKNIENLIIWMNFFVGFYFYKKEKVKDLKIILKLKHRIGAIRKFLKSIASIESILYYYDELNCEINQNTELYSLYYEKNIYF